MAYSIDELRKCMKALKEHGSKTAAADALGLHYSSLARRIAAAQRLPEFQENKLPAGKAGRKTGEIDEQTALLILAAWKANRYSIKGLASAAKTSESSVRLRLSAAQAVVGEVTQDEIAKAQAAAVERSLDDEITIRKARSEASQARSRLSDATDEITRLRARLTDLEAVVRSDAAPADWTLTQRRGERSEHIPMLFTSDFQIGEVIRPAETEHGHGYDTETFRKRYRHMIDTTIYLSFEHVSEDWHYPGIVYARGGDTVSGQIHDELAETDDVTPIRAVEIAFEEEAAGIRKLADAFGRVDVKDCGGGNHDRVTKKPRAKQAWSNLDRLVSFMLQREFAGDERVHFQTTESMDVFFPIYQRNYLLTHGDRIGSRGGQGFIGPAATIMRGAQKVVTEQQALGRHVDCVMMGHFHTPFWYDWVLVNGSMPGYSEFAKQNRMRPHDPQQWLLYHHARRGVVDLKPIILTDA